MPIHQEQVVFNEDPHSHWLRIAGTHTHKHKIHVYKYHAPAGHFYTTHALQGPLLKKEFLKSGYFYTLLVTISKMAAILAAILKRNLSCVYPLITRTPLKKEFLKSTQFCIWLITILYMAAILAAILKRNLSCVIPLITKTTFKKRIFKIGLFLHLISHYFKYGGHIGRHFERKCILRHSFH